MSHGNDAALDLLTAHDLTLSQIRCLITVFKTGAPLPIHELADQVGISDASAGRNVDQLVKLGLLVRQEDPHDRRTKLISLSQAGGRLLSDTLIKRQEQISSLLAGIGEPICRTLYRALQPVLAALNAQGPGTAATCGVSGPRPAPGEAPSEGRAPDEFDEHPPESAAGRRLTDDPRQHPTAPNPLEVPA